MRKAIAMAAIVFGSLGFGWGLAACSEPTRYEAPPEPEEVGPYEGGSELYIEPFTLETEDGRVVECYWVEDKYSGYGSSYYAGGPTCDWNNVEGR